MEELFHTDETDLDRFFGSIQEEDILDACHEEVYYRGRDYFENGYVRRASLNARKTILTANVSGTREYKVEIRLAGGAVGATCSCPYGGLCKHVVAALLHAFSSDLDIERNTDSDTTAIRKHLEALSHPELVDLVMKHASPDFFTSIRNQGAKSVDALKELRAVKRNLVSLFGGDGAPEEPEAFERELEAELGKLAGLESKITTQAAELVMFVIGAAETALDEGKLYNHYLDYNFEFPPGFRTFLTNTALAMDFEKKMDFIADLDHVAQNSQYGISRDIYPWLGDCFGDKDVAKLRTALLNEHTEMSRHLVASYYKQTLPVLTSNDREEILTTLAKADSTWTAELAEVMAQNGKRKKSIVMLRKLTAGGGKKWGVDEKLCYLYLDQLHAEGLPIAEPAARCLALCPTSRMLTKVCSLLPKKAPAFEEVLEAESATALLEYFMQNGRHKDALALVKKKKKIPEENAFTFYKRYKKQYPADATAFFRLLIDKHLDESGDYHYQKITDALEHMAEIDRNYAEVLAFDIRRNYKRRGKLMTMLTAIKL